MKVRLNVPSLPDRSKKVAQTTYEVDPAKNVAQLQQLQADHL
jgi:hypothetical protein